MKARRRQRTRRSRHPRCPRSEPGSRREGDGRGDRVVPLAVIHEAGRGSYEWPAHCAAPVWRMARMRCGLRRCGACRASGRRSRAWSRSQPRGLAPGSSVLVLGRTQGLGDVGALGCGERRDFVRPGWSCRLRTRPAVQLRTAPSSTLETWTRDAAAMSVARRAEAEVVNKAHRDIRTIAREAWRQTEIYCKTAGFRGKRKTLVKNSSDYNCLRTRSLTISM